MKWRLRFSKYELEVHYKKGKLNNQADALSLLTSNGHTTEQEDTETPCLIIDVTSDEEEEEGEETHLFIERPSGIGEEVSIKRVELESDPLGSIPTTLAW